MSVYFIKDSLAEDSIELQKALKKTKELEQITEEYNKKLEQGTEKIELQYANKLNEANSKLSDMSNEVKSKRIHVENTKDSTVELFELTNYGGQGKSQGEIPIGLPYHNYTDGIMAQLDNVGENNDILILKNANNPHRRLDKPEDFIGTGNFLTCLKHRPNGQLSQKIFQLDCFGNSYWFERDDSVCFGTGKTANEKAAFKLQAFSKHKALLQIENGYNPIFNLSEENGNLVLNSIGELDFKILSAGANTIIDANKDIYIQRIPKIYTGEFYATPLLGGAGAERPTKGLYPGYQFFDTQHNKPIWRNRDNNGWVDAMGESI